MKKLVFILLPALAYFIIQCKRLPGDFIMTVNGPVPASEIGKTLTHEHILVDFIGADSISESRWDKAFVMARLMPYLDSIKQHGCTAFIDATPEYIGRDPMLLRNISEAAGMHIVTNTGYYGAAANKFIPQHAYTETADELAVRWTGEWIYGIGETGIKPGFIKIGVARDSLSELHAKLVTAAARTHLRTGLVIASHTGPALPAFQQIEILKNEGVDPSAFIWVHAQGEKDRSKHILAAREGAWVSLDGLGEDNTGEYVLMIENAKENGVLDKVLLSHDAGWFDPARENGGDVRGYTTLFRKLVPALKANGFTASEIDQLLIDNPSRAFAVRIRKNGV